MKKEKEISFWSQALFLAVKNNPKDFEKFFINLKNALVKKQELIPAVIKKFERIYQAEQKAKLVLAKNIEEKERKNIEEKIKAIIGLDKEIEYSVDSELLAGFRLKTKDFLIKASLKDILMGLKNKLYGHN
jgi:F0F1-type ATP synthase delta subunit